MFQAEDILQKMEYWAPSLLLNISNIISKVQTKKMKIIMFIKT